MEHCLSLNQLVCSAACRHQTASELVSGWQAQLGPLWGERGMLGAALQAATGPGTGDAATAGRRRRDVAVCPSDRTTDGEHLTGDGSHDLRRAVQTTSRTWQDKTKRKSLAADLRSHCSPVAKYRQTANTLSALSPYSLPATCHPPTCPRLPNQS
jgi:hypothetical protein